MTAGDSVEPSAVSNFWQAGGPGAMWTWWADGLPGVKLRLSFGGTFLQIVALCSIHGMGLEQGGACHQCRGGTGPAENALTGWAATYPLDRIGMKEAAALSHTLVPFLEDFAGEKCDLLSTTIRAYEIAENLTHLLWALHPWSNGYAAVPITDSGRRDLLQRFQEELDGRMALWEEFLVLWPRGLDRVGAREHVSILDSLLS